MFLFLNDFGVDILLTVTDSNCNPVDISTSTAREFELQKPDGSITTVTALFVTNGTDGKLRYTVASGVLNVVGTWSVRAKITEGATKLFRTEKISFAVKN